MKNFNGKQRGFSLVELMISITLGLLILAAMISLFSNQSKARSELDKSNRMIDNGRFALEILTDNIRAAGFYGSYIPGGTPATLPEPCDVALLTANNGDVLLDSVQGYNAATVSSTIASLPASCGFGYTTGIILKPGSDLLVLRRASTAAPVAAASAVASALYLQVSNCTTDVSSYRIAAGTADFSTLRNKDCTTAASLRAFLVQTYFVAPDNKPGDGIPTLKRRELDAVSGTFVTTALVEGIEYLQVDYGLDADADGAADSYLAAPALTDWPNIVSARISVIARNVELSSGYTDSKIYMLGSAGIFGPFNDAYKRHAYTQVVRLVNPSARREIS